MKVTDKQDLLIRNVKTADEAWRNAKKNAIERALARATEEITEFYALRNLAVRAAVTAGAPKNQVMIRGLGTTASKTMKEALDATEGVAVVSADMETDPLAHRYALADEVLTVTLAGLDLQRAVDEVSWAHPSTPPASAKFQVAERPDGSVYLRSLAKAFMADVGEQHPVVAFIQRDGAEALAWVYEQMGLAA